jgi:hypothetical protein
VSPPVDGGRPRSNCRSGTSVRRSRVRRTLVRSPIERLFGNACSSNVCPNDVRSPGTNVRSSSDRTFVKRTYDAPCVVRSSLSPSSLSLSLSPSLVCGEQCRGVTNPVTCLADVCTVVGGAARAPTRDKGTPNGHEYRLRTRGTRGMVRVARDARDDDDTERTHRGTCDP